MNGNYESLFGDSISHTSSNSEVGPTQEIIEETRAECEDILAAHFPSVDRARIERIVNGVILSLQNSYPHPEAPIQMTSPHENDDDDNNSDSTVDETFGSNTRRHL
jgi:hypothetical protein